MLEAREPRVVVEEAGKVLPKTIISVLLLSKLRKLAPIHALMSTRQLSNGWSAACPTVFRGRYSWTSSAKQLKEMLCFRKISPKGSIYSRNRMGPRIEP